MKAKHILSGIRATGKLHLGHYHGTLKNWLDLQNAYECFFFVADWHALTTNYAHTENIALITRNMVIEWLAVGIDPNKAHIYVQSQIPEIAEINLILGMITPLGWLERVPTYKEQKQQQKDKDLTNFGFLGYPVLQAADILSVKANKVPVGQDQVSHIEIAREIARRFNYIYGKGKVILPEPEALLTVMATFPGLDGRKMSKSYDNTINLSDDVKTVEQKILAMPTDPARVKRLDKGDPEKCPVWSLHKIYSTQNEKDWVMHGCKTAEIGCIDCKKCLFKSIIEEQEPIQKRIMELQKNSAIVDDIILQGKKKAQEVASAVKDEIYTAVGLLK